MFGLKTTAGTLALTWVICMLAFLEECQPLSSAWQVLPETPKCAVSDHPALFQILFLHHTQTAVSDAGGDCEAFDLTLSR